MRRGGIKHTCLRTARRRRADACVLALLLVTGTLGCPSAPPADDAAVDVVNDRADDAAVVDSAMPAPEATTRSGPVIGTRGTGFQEFLGIPYAAPPVGALRWRPPQPVASWTTPRRATDVPSRCPQRLLSLGTSGQEDCLYLNVHTPDPRPTGAPVLVWIHGGGFALGEGLQTDRSTRGDIVARTAGIVVVSLNYRLGALGFLAHPALDAERPERVSGNYGLLDQTAALEWVRDNIAAFGGDPARVTIAGESAGGSSVCAHLLMPASARLFARAIVQSGPCGRTAPTLTESAALGTRFVTGLGCDTATDVAGCMRMAPVARILETLPPSPSLVETGPMYGRWGPAVDGRVMPGQPMSLFASGTFHRVPVLFGWNRDEGTLFTHLWMGTSLTPAGYPAAVAALLSAPSAVTDRVLAQYPLSAFPTPSAALSAVIGDYALACPARRAFRAMQPHLPSSYTYYFTYPDAPFQLASVPLGAYHSGEIQYLFGHPSRIGQSRFNGADLTLHQVMLGYWSRFVATGDPNGAGSVEWPRYDAVVDRHVVLDVMPSTGVNASTTACAFWETTGLY